MANQIMRITLKAYDHKLVDASAKKIIETVKKTGWLLPSFALFISIRTAVSSSSRELTRD